MSNFRRAHTRRRFPQNQSQGPREMRTYQLTGIIGKRVVSKTTQAASVGHAKLKAPGLGFYAYPDELEIVEVAA